MVKSIKEITAHYIKRFPDFSLDIDFTFSSSLRTIIVIPCFKEPEIIKTLKALAACDKPKQNTLVLILVNASEEASEDVKNYNQNTFLDIQDFISNNKSEILNFYCFINNEMPKKHAGVGYARKTLMDTALKIFSTNETDGIIVNTDADCLFSHNYLTSIEDTFQDEKLELAVLHYEHRIEEEKDPVLAKGITEYELHLRYYKQALEWTNYPKVLETIGSCMVCLASTYALEGGMNKRKAGEDFYFINKLAKSRVSTTITQATVLPSCRTSDRVPFGTGKAMNDYVVQETETFQTYDFECFFHLKSLLLKMMVLYEKDFNALKKSDLNPLTFEYLEKIGIEKNLKEMKKQSNNIERFLDRFFYWFDHLKALQFIHFYTENKYSKVDIKDAAHQLVIEGEPFYSFDTNYELLRFFRTNEIKQFKYGSI